MADISDTPLVSMVLVDDENNRTTFTGPIINDFTITEDLQNKITQLTTLATNISNLQTRLTNITNILNTQNIEFTDNISDVSSVGSKLYIQPQVYLKIEGYSSDESNPIIIRYLNITPFFTGKHNFPEDVVTQFNCSLDLDSSIDINTLTATFGPNSLQDLSVQVNATVETVAYIFIGDSTVYQDNSVTSENSAYIGVGNNTIQCTTSTGKQVEVHMVLNVYEE